MSRRIINVMAAAVFVVAIQSLIPQSTGAVFNATAPANVSITFDIPDAAPTSVAPADEQSDAVEQAPTASPDVVVPEQKPTQQPSTDVAEPVESVPTPAPSVPEVTLPTPEVTPAPMVVEPTPVEPVVSAPPVVIPEVAPAPQPEVVVVEAAPEVAAVVAPIPEPTSDIELAPNASVDADITLEELPVSTDIEGSVNEEIAQ